MKKLIALFMVFSLALSTAGTAQADGRYHGGYRPPPPRHHHHHHDKSDWVGPAAVLAITGLAIGAAAYNSRPAEPTYYVTPPRSVEPPMGTGYWYYCESSGQYYPYTRYCPGGWQAVLPPR